MANFDEERLRALAEIEEVAIRTEKHPQSAVVIWVVVDGGEVFIRSVKGAKGRWYKDLAAGGRASLEFSGLSLAVEAVPAADERSIARASRQYLAKYRASPYAEAMVREEVLATTLRVEPC